ncbi:hypothetical protein AVEN_102558-1 [Araneus ventricosus]|uniref:Uncharacterized protein n=1 Tax=Araneus ventricosus TaxID=182803 RepID=A0A4Y2BIB1_ARAVE|nr:hypothetical protein AVEN_102558-1 [Araneus ventricosus]
MYIIKYVHKEILKSSYLAFPVAAFFGSTSGSLLGPLLDPLRHLSPVPLSPLFRSNSLTLEVGEKFSFWPAVRRRLNVQMKQNRHFLRVASIVAVKSFFF